MPVVGPVLGSLVQQRVDARMRQQYDYAGPLASKGASYFITMCNAIGIGIAKGIPTVLFTTVDSGVEGTPFVPGVGAGVGIVMDFEYMSEHLYTKIKQKVQAVYHRTLAEDWPVPPKGRGRFTEALARGVSEAVKEHFAKVWILTSAHPMIYAGVGLINAGMFTGVQAQAIKGAILAAAPILNRGAWPLICEAIAEATAETIMLRATGKVTITGTCVPSISQVCGIPSTGAGSGVAA